MKYVYLLMTNITFSVDQDLHRKMKNHPEIKWSEILRRAIIDYLTKIEEPSQISVKDLRNQLDPELLQRIDNMDPEYAGEFYKQAKKVELERTKRLWDLERSSER